MSKVSICLSFSLILISSIFFSGCTLFSRPIGGLKIDTDIPSKVSLSGKEIGETPLQKKPLDAGKYELKLTPSDSSLVPMESPLRIIPGFETTVMWTFGKTKEDSSGVIIEMNKGGGSKGEIELTTSPDNVPVTLLGANKGFSPLSLTDLEPGDYTLGVSAPGYNPLNTELRILAGKKLVIYMKLSRKPLIATPIITPTIEGIATTAAVVAATPVATSSGVNEIQPVLKTTNITPYVEILSTETNFLRVRNEASAKGTELYKLAVGSKVAYANASQSGWLQVVYDGTKKGWISSTYAKLFE